MALKKDEAIKAIMADYEELSNIVLNQLDLVENIVTSVELEIKEDVVAQIEKNEKEVNKIEVKLSDKIVNTIVLYQPFASDLRKMMACYRIVISLERISDLVINITNFMKKMKDPEVYVQMQEVLQNMIIQAIRMVKEALLSFLNNDRELAIWTLKNEPAFEEINKKLLKKMIKKRKGEEPGKKFLLSIISIKEMMSNIERIADHATNVAEASIYYIDGKDIRHTKIPE